MIPNNILQMLGKMNVNMRSLQSINSPDELAQYLMNTGRVSQAQVNQARQMWNNPQIQQQIQNMK